jgi:hypothetical protein
MEDIDDVLNALDNEVWAQVKQPGIAPGSNPPRVERSTGSLSTNSSDILKKTATTQSSTNQVWKNSDEFDCGTTHWSKQDIQPSVQLPGSSLSMECER